MKYAFVYPRMRHYTMEQDGTVLGVVKEYPDGNQWLGGIDGNPVKDMPNHITGWDWDNPVRLTRHFDAGFWHIQVYDTLEALILAHLGILL